MGFFVCGLGWIESREYGGEVGNGLNSGGLGLSGGQSTAESSITARNYGSIAGWKAGSTAESSITARNYGSIAGWKAGSTAEISERA